MELQNEMTKAIEGIMKDYGGDKWSKTTLDAFKTDVNQRLTEASIKLKGPQKFLCLNLIKKLKKQGSVQDQLMALNEAYFSLSESEQC